MNKKKAALVSACFAAAFIMVLLDVIPAEARRFGGFRGFRSSRSYTRSYRSYSRRSYTPRRSYTRRSTPRRSYTRTRSRGFRTTSRSRRASMAGSSWMKRGRAGSAGVAASRKYSRQNYERFRRGARSGRYSQTGSKRYRSYVTRRQAVRSRPLRAGNYYTSSRRRHMGLNRSYYRPYFWGPYGYPMWGYRRLGMWDLAFLLTASHLFWHHHWNEMRHYRTYFDRQKWTQMEARVKALEAKGVKRDPNYLDPNLAPDLQFSKQFAAQNPAVAYPGKKAPKGEEPSGFFGWVLGLVLAMGIGGAIWFIFIRRT